MLMNSDHQDSHGSEASGQELHGPNPPLLQKKKKTRARTTVSYLHVWLHHFSPDYATFLGELGFYYLNKLRRRLQIFLLVCPRVPGYILINKTMSIRFHKKYFKIISHFLGSCAWI